MLRVRVHPSCETMCMPSGGEQMTSSCLLSTISSHDRTAQDLYWAPSRLSPKWRVNAIECLTAWWSHHSSCLHLHLPPCGCCLQSVCCSGARSTCNIVIVYRGLFALADRSGKKNDFKIANVDLLPCNMVHCLCEPAAVMGGGCSKANGCYRDENRKWRVEPALALALCVCVLTIPQKKRQQ